MADRPTDPPTHIGWAQYRERGKFVEWRQVGPARETRDAKGITRTYFSDRAIPRGHTGYIWILPIGETPPDPPPDDPKRPASSAKDGETMLNLLDE